jgi:hypothetical protein
MLRTVAIVVASTVAALCSTAASAQDFGAADPTDSYFDGFYAGILYGAAGNAHGNFFPAGGIARGEVGGFAGWNFEVAPGLIAGGELLGAVQSDFAGTYSAGFAALGQIGALVEEDIAFFLVGGGGYLGSAPALVFGARAEMGVYDNMSVRAEILNFVEVGAGAHPGVTGQMLNAGIVWHLGEGASGPAGLRLDLDSPASLPDFDGGYAGASFGLHYNAPLNFFPDIGFGGHPSRADLGAVAGWNFRLEDTWVVAGIEAQAGLLTDTSGDVALNAWGLGRLGLTPFDGLLVYGQAGAGVVQGKGAYGVGGGVEFAAFDDATVRFEGLAYGEIGAAAFSAGKGSAAVLWHLD